MLGLSLDWLDYKINVVMTTMMMFEWRWLDDYNFYSMNSA